VPDNEVDAVCETLRQWIKDLEAAVERIKTDPRTKIDPAAIAAISQRIKDLEAAVERINAALPPPN
jgi:ubiquinone biosynthesis protein UbiJ